MAPLPTNGDDDDPFGAFGSDDDEEDILTDNEASRIAQSLVQLANNKRNARTDAYERPSPLEDVKTATVADVQPIGMPWKKPLYLGPIQLVSMDQYGGGRAYVAEQDVVAGTLVLIERAALTWPDEQLGKELGLVSVQHCLESAYAQQLLVDLEHCHPTKRAVDGDEPSDDAQVADMMNLLKKKYQNDSTLLTLVTFAQDRGLCNSNGSALTATDCLRLLLALRYNGLESGVYLHTAMLNHDDRPNCVKFRPDNMADYSEVRTTRSVRAGLALTISYLPSIQCHASRRKHLWEQHRFDIGADLRPEVRAMELVGGRLPPSALEKWKDDFLTHQIERAVDELRLSYHELDPLWSSLADVEPNEQVLEHAKALEQASLELCTQAMEQLCNNQHILLIPCLSLHLDCADRVQTSVPLTSAQRMLLLGRMVRTALQLVELQQACGGPDHFDVARTYHDLAQGIEELLSRSAKTLLDLHMTANTSIAAWSSLEYKARAEYSRIKALYPRDAGNYL